MAAAYTEATRNPPTRYAAMTMWAACSGIESLKITSIGSTLDHVAGRVEGEARRGVHPRVGGDDGDAAEDPGESDRNAGPEVGPRLQPAPSEDVDRDEDRLGEEEQPLERERDTERLTPPAHERRPEQTELEAEHSPGHRPDGERDGHVLRPPLRQHERVPVVMPQRSIVGDQRHERPGDAQRHQDDVARQRERHLGTGPRHGVHRSNPRQAAQHRGHGRPRLLLPRRRWVSAPAAR